MNLQLMIVVGCNEIDYIQVVAENTTDSIVSVQSRHFIQGWSLPHDVAAQSLQDMDFIQSIPAPIYCGPLGSLDNERKSLVRCCATANDDDPLTTRYMTWVSGLFLDNYFSLFFTFGRWKSDRLLEIHSRPLFWNFAMPKL